MKISEKNRIREYFTHSSSDDEDFVASMFLEEGNEAELREIACEHWEETPSTRVELQHILDRIHEHIRTRDNRHNMVKRVLSAYYRAAAILLIPVLIAGIYVMWHTPNMDKIYAEIRAPKGSRIQFTLPDGSTGFLNGGSQLQYPVNFLVNRKVNLAGEGYFEVVKNKKHPFIVQTKYADVQVFGTKFDVCAYGSDKEVLTTLEEGSVRIHNKANATSTDIRPGEQNVINTSDGSMKTTPVNIKLYTSWKEEMLRFYNSPFDEVVKKMERWYGVRIILDKSLKYTENYTFTIKTESLRELLQLLSITTPMSFKIENDTVMIYPVHRK